MSAVKAKLKAARDSINAKDWARTVETCNDIFEFEPNNYNAYVFLGVAYGNLKDVKNSVQSYRKAVDTDPTQVLAWQGLSKLFEEQQDWKNLAEVTLNCIQLFNEKKDANKLAEQLVKLVNLQRRHGTTEQIIDALSMLLPSSSLYPTLLDLPPFKPTEPDSNIAIVQQALRYPVSIMLEMCTIIETSESQQIQFEINQSRTRITSVVRTAEETQKFVQRRIMSKSRLPDLYLNILDHPDTSEEDRRSAESKLLKYRTDFLVSVPLDASVLPPNSGEPENLPTKESLRNDILSLANDMVLLKVSNELAWSIALDWKDAALPSDYDTLLLETSASVLPLSPISDVIKAHLYFQRVAETPEASLDEEVKDTEEKPLNDQSAREILEDAYERTKNMSLLCHFLCIEYFEEWNGHESTIRVAESAHRLIRKIQKDTGISLNKSMQFFSAKLSHAFTHVEPPKHHRRAKRLLTELLKPFPHDETIMFDMGIVFQYEEKWKEAGNQFERVLSLSDLHEDTRMKARGELSWCRVNLEDYDNGQNDLSEVIKYWEQEKKVDDSNDELSKLLSLLWWRLGQCQWRKGEQQESFSSFINSIKHSPTFAPSFTSLGLFYLQVCSPPNHARASQCLQKAFELDSSEEVAAKLLADEFSSSGDWDLVEVVARRVVESDYVNAPSASNRTVQHGHTWAYRAVGTADFYGKKYSSAISAFQSALRAEPDDLSTWMKLGLAYTESGRHIAALKTFSRALEVDSSAWQIKVCIGDVYRALGILDSAIETYEAILESQPGETGVQLILAETHFLQARQLREKGVNLRTRFHLEQALISASSLLQHENGTRLSWKVVAESLIEFAFIYANETVITRQSLSDVCQNALFQILQALEAVKIDTKISGIEGVELATVSEYMNSESTDAARLFTFLAILAGEMRLSVEMGAKKSDNLDASWFDLGITFDLARKLASKFSEVTGNNDGDDDNERNIASMHSKERLELNSIYCVRQALQSDPTNWIYWNALGVFAIKASARISQHSFIRSAELNSKSAVPWANLGFFYLNHSDVELANQSFLRAQTIEPELPEAWIGQAILALENKDYSSAKSLINHTISISNGRLPFADFIFSLDVFGELPSSVGTSTRPWSSRLLVGQFAAERFVNNIPDDASGLLLYGLMCERLGKLENAIESIGRASELLEEQYEREESREAETRYIIVNLSLGRVKLAQGDFTGALDAVENSIMLTGTALEEGENNENDNDFIQRNIARIQSLCIKGLSNHFIGNYPDAVESLREAQMSFEQASSTIQKSADGSAFENIGNHIVLLLTKVLWSNEEGKDEAKNLLLTRISDHNTGQPVLSSIVALSAMAIEEGDDQLLDAAISEVTKLPNDQKEGLDPAGDVEKLLVDHALILEDEKLAKAILSRSVYVQPSSLSARLELARFLIRTRNENDGRAITISELLYENRNDTNNETDAHDEAEVLRIRAIARKLEGDSHDAFRLASRAVKLDPENEKSWITLSYCQGVDE